MGRKEKQNLLLKKRKGEKKISINPRLVVDKFSKSNPWHRSSLQTGRKGLPSSRGILPLPSAASAWASGLHSGWASGRGARAEEAEAAAACSAGAAAGSRVAQGASRAAALARARPSPLRP